MSDHSDPRRIELGLDFGSVDVARVRHREDLFFVLCAASFVKSAAALCTHGLAAQFASDPPLQTWLRQHGTPDDLRHGRALADYVRHAWPEFAWDKAFKAFCQEYAVMCAAEPMPHNHTLALAAWCARRAGSAGRHGALHQLTDEPVWMQLTNQIKSEDVGHFKYVCQQHRLYRQRDNVSRVKVVRVLLQGLASKARDDHAMALRYIFYQCYPQHRGNELAFRHVSDRTRRLLRRHASAGMTVKMLLNPLDLPGRVHGAVEKPLTGLTQLLLLR